MVAETFNQRLERRAQALLDETIATMQINLGGGHAEDYAEYKRICGHMAGLRQAKQLIEQAHTESLRS